MVEWLIYCWHITDKGIIKHLWDKLKKPLMKGDMPWRKLNAR